MSLIMKKLKLASDKERWELLMANKDSNLVVKLDNDDTYIVDNNDEDEEAEYVTFDGYIGNGPGIPDLLEAIGVECEGV